MPLLLLLAASILMSADYSAPAGNRPAARRPGAESILPGGRIIAPLGRQYGTGPGPFGLAISPRGYTVATSDGGPQRYSLTLLTKDGKHWRVRHVLASRAKEGNPEPDEDDWHSVFMGLAFRSDGELYASDGNAGRVLKFEPGKEKPSRVFDLNEGGFEDTYTGDIVLDRKRAVLYVVDQANFRVVSIDLRKDRIVGSVRVGRLPFALALSPAGDRLYVTNLGMFQYSPIPGADSTQARETGLPFPAFGFPSQEAVRGVSRETMRGPVRVPGLGHPNVDEANSLAVVDVSDPGAPKVLKFIRTGLPFGPSSFGGSSPSGVVATADAVFVSNAHNDSITVIDVASLEVRATIPIRVPGLEHLRGVLPIGVAYHASSGRLLVAEAGINAIGVIDPRAGKVLGHLPVGWFPTRVLTEGNTVFVANAKGHGTGPNSDPAVTGDTFQGVFRRGTISIFRLPEAGEISKLTERVYKLNGLAPKRRVLAGTSGRAVDTGRGIPKGIRHVVLIVKENRTFDEVFGDIASASNGRVASEPQLARFGRAAAVSSEPKTLKVRGELRKVNVSPNHHEMAARWTFSDNFYADSEVSVDGHHWLVGSYPNAWTESSLMAAYGGQKDFRLGTTAPGRLQMAGSNSSVHPEEQLEAGAIWHHLERHGISFRNFGEGFELAGVNEGEGLKPTGARYLTNVPMPDPLYRNTSREYPQYNMNIPDQYRASQFIAEIERDFVKPGKPLPRFIYIHLPNDHTAKPRPQDGYPFTASYMADNDLALARIVEFLSKTPYWREMAIFVTEDDAQGWVDHIDSHRTVLLIASPYGRKNYASHVNSSFPGLLKTIFRILDIPPLNLFDAIASDLSDCFTNEPDFTPYRALPADKRIFDPEKAKEPLDPEPSPRMDDPRFLREQHRGYGR